MSPVTGMDALIDAMESERECQRERDVLIARLQERLEAANNRADFFHAQWAEAQSEIVRLRAASTSAPKAAGETES